MGTLFECLREARLEKFYPAFRANGITRSESLINLGMPEFSALGITGTEDKRRLTELVNIIKSVHNSGLSSSPNVSRRTSRNQPTSPYSHAETGNDNPPPGRNASHERHASERVPNFSAASYADMMEYLSGSSESESAEEECSDEDIEREQVPLPSAVRSSTARAGRIERIQHSKTKGYNYGVHKVTTTPKHRSSRTSSSSQRNFAGDERIKVCVRKRGLSRREQRAKDDDIVSVESTNMLIVNEPKLAVDLKAYTLQHEFIFDEVFDEACSNQDVYIRAARPLISCIFNGGTATCFAYGQTGAGKTYTMLGNAEVPGLYLLAGEDIFSIIQSKQYGSDLHVWVSYFEVYCGQLFDLLNRRNRLYAREDGNKQVCIAGLTETEAADVQSLIQIMDYGNSVRSKGATGVNPDSSRSHAILQLDIRDQEDVKLGKMSFIDLAGSERGADVTDSDRQTRFEGAEINQSLLALKECIRSIDQDSRHTPFRQSKLTHILKDSFVGNSKTCMIANISPAHSAGENTLNTLRYADRVKELKRDSVRSSTVGRAMNLLMNIPPTGPSIFHPSNILSTSTPNRQGPVSRVQRSNNPQSEITLDPSETPIRGHNLPRRARLGGPKHRTSQNQPAEPPHSHQHQHDILPPSFSAEHRTLVVPRARSLPASSLATAAAASIGASVPPPDASPSDSDQTDTDSCNVTNPTNLNTRTLSGRGVPVARSSDTEFDFPTSDFNAMDEINDLNRPNLFPRQDEVTPTASHSFRTVDSTNVGSGAAAAASSESPVALSNPTSRRAPVVKAVVYKSRDYTTDEPPPQKGSKDKVESKKSDVSSVQSPKVSHHSPTFPHKSNFFEVLSSDSMDEEEMLAESPSKSSGTSPALNNLAPNHSKPDETSAVSQSRHPVGASAVPFSRNPVIMNKNLMVPLVANSSDLAKFTQRPSISQTDSSNKTNVPANRNKTSIGYPTNKPESLRTEDQSRMTSETRESPSEKDRFPAESHPNAQTSPLISRHHHQQPISQAAEQQNSGHTSLSPKSDIPLYHSPKPPELSSERSLRRRRASQSPTGDVSDDSTDSIRASVSDQGPAKNQPGTGENYRSGMMRKERSDPMLALSMQRKKHTLPDPQNISRKLTRASSSPKAGGGSCSQNMSSGLKVVHTDTETSPPNAPRHHHHHHHHHHQPFGVSNTPSGNHTESSSSQLPVSSVESQSQHHSHSYHRVDDATIPEDHGGWRSSERAGVAAAFGATGRGDGSSPREKELSSSSSSSSSAKPREIVIHRLDGSKQWLPAQVPWSAQMAEKDGKKEGKNQDVILGKDKSLASGAVFSPIHPQPVTSAATTHTENPIRRESLPPSSSAETGGAPMSSSSSTITPSSRMSSSSSSMSTLVQPTPVTDSTAAAAASWVGSSVDSGVPDGGLSQAAIDGRLHLVSTHEDQLATITSLCKYEMRLLLNAKKSTTKKGFDDYVNKINEILNQKVTAITSLQEEIRRYRSSNITSFTQSHGGV